MIIKKVASVLIVSLLILVSYFNLGCIFEDFENNFLVFDLEHINNSENNKIQGPPSFIGSRTSRSLVDSDIFGGCWLDSFEDDSGVDWIASDHLNVSAGDARIHIPYYADPFTVAMLHFDNGSGNKAYDMTKYQNDGSISGASWTSGKYGGGLSFDGINDGVDVPDSLSLSIKESVTISFWMNFTDIPSIKYPILKKRDAGTDSYQIEMINTGKMRFLVDTGSAGMIDTTTVLNDGDWHFVTATWDQSIMKIYVDGKLDATPVTKTGKMVDTPDKMTIGYGRRVQGGNSYWDYYDGLIDDLRISNIARSAKEIKDAYENSTPIAKRYANLTSKTISLPLGMKWNTLAINKTQPQNTFLNITILNSINDQPIPGTPKFINEGEFDISYINPISYPSIKLSADFKGNSDYTPTLHYWGVSWNTSNSWKDTIFGGDKVEYIDPVNIDVMDGEVRFNAPSSMISSPILLPENSHYDTLKINKIESEDTHLDVAILDANTNVNISGFENLSETLIDLSTIDILKYPAIKLKGTFEVTEPGNAVLYDWSLNWTENIPKIETITSQSAVNRTHQVIIGINIKYRPETINRLTLQVEHKSTSSNDWQSKYISNIAFVTDRWQCIFTPALDAELGLYSFRFTCNNSYQRLDIYVELDFIEVINNKPTPPEVMITPIEPQTMDDLTVIIKNANDIETSSNKLTYMYRWYRNDIHVSMFNDQTSISNSATAKDEVWRCEVYPFDGDDFGNPGFAENTIQNSPPDLVEDFIEFQMFEDSPVVLDEKLHNIFIDLDSDPLVFSANGQSNITVKIIQENGTIELIPALNWFGTESITFYANDSSPITAEVSVLVTVKPTNDLPVITHIGDQSASGAHTELEFIIKQYNWLNLTIQVEDIDGDVASGLVSFIFNISNRENFYLDNNKIFFFPTNQEVGLHFLSISITDNNETPMVYISQNLKIHVINVNDPPTVMIIQPATDTEYLESDEISLECVAYDIDLLVKDSNEELTFQWISDLSGVLGTRKRLTNLTLPPGVHNVYIRVEDVEGEVAHDYIHIKIKEVPKEEDISTSTQLFSSANLWLWLLILLIIILIICGLFIVNHMRRRRSETTDAQGGHVLTPVEAYQDAGSVQGILQTPQKIDSPPLGLTQASEQLAASTTSVPTVQSQQQLPPARTLESQDGAAAASIGLRLNLQQRIDLLEERMLHGEISQDTYFNLKEKYELDLKKFQPLPQLPPAPESASTSTAPAQAQVSVEQPVEESQGPPLTTTQATTTEHDSKDIQPPEEEK